MICTAFSLHLLLHYRTVVLIVYLEETNVPYRRQEYRQNLQTNRLLRHLRMEQKTTHSPEVGALVPFPETLHLFQKAKDN